MISEIMADQAGPSGAGNAAVGKTVEETQFLFNTGVACIKVTVAWRGTCIAFGIDPLILVLQANALEMAADIFAQVLRARTARYGGVLERTRTHRKPSLQGNAAVYINKV